MSRRKNTVLARTHAKSWWSLLFWQRNAIFTVVSVSLSITNTDFIEWVRRFCKMPRTQAYSNSQAFDEKAEVDQDLTETERSLLGNAYKRSVAKYRTAYAVCAEMKQKETARANYNNIQRITQYQTELAQKIEQLCTELIELIDSSLMQNAKRAESVIAFKKMKGDYCRYLADFSQKSDSAHKALQNYEEALELCR